VTPVVGYLGRLDVQSLERLSKARAADPRKKSPTLMAIALEELLSRESVDARVVPGVGPMPVFNAHAPPERPLQIWGLTAQILHAVMRVVVGPRAEYADALYGPFMRKTQIKRVMRREGTIVLRYSSILYDSRFARGGVFVCAFCLRFFRDDTHIPRQNAWVVHDTGLPHTTSVTCVCICTP
jgi:hypothetical protein